jgi:hypothetical protein
MGEQIANYKVVSGETPPTPVCLGWFSTKWRQFEMRQKQTLQKKLINLSDILIQFHEAFHLYRLLLFICFNCGGAA